MCTSAPPAAGWRGSRSFRIRMRQACGIRSESPQRVRDPQPPDDPERLQRDPLVELRDAPGAVQEEELDLLDPGAVLHEAIVELDLEGVAVGADPLETDPLQQLAPDAAEPAGGVADREPGHEARVGVSEPADQDPLD